VVEHNSANRGLVGRRRQRREQQKKNHPSKR
jgi:hypothetical protein